jgi:hypothetical protein
LGKDDVHRFSLQADDPIVAIAIHQQATVVAYKARCQARPAFAPARAAQLADFEQREAPFLLGHGASAIQRKAEAERLSWVRSATSHLLAEDYSEINLRFRPAFRNSGVK